MSGAGTAPGREHPRRRRSGRAPRSGWRFLTARVAGQLRRDPSRTELLRRVFRALALAWLAAALAAPFALAWGLGHARAEEYVGPHRATFLTNFSGEIQVDLGPLGNAYLDSPAAPVGLRVEIGGISGSSGGSLFSPETLSAYAALYADPAEAAGGLLERIRIDVLAESAKAELVLLVAVALWLLRRRLLAPTLVPQISRRRVLMTWAALSVLVIGSVLAPRPPPGTTRIPLVVEVGGRTWPLSVDSVLLAELLDRGIKGVRLLTERQQADVEAYVRNATLNLSGQLDRLPQVRPGETLVFGYSDLHCNQAMTRLLTGLVAVTNPAVVLSAGDDTVHGTAAERGCIRREAEIAGGRPLLVAAGNHDSPVTEQQMQAAGMVVLDGRTVPVDAAGLTVLGDDDPEHNIPFSVERTLKRPESQEQLGLRMLEVARAAPVDVLVLHQPSAAYPMIDIPDPPARLVIWGHMHAQGGPLVLPHADGSWTVGMQQGTAGGVKQPTIASFSTPFSPPLVRADVYFYFRDDATGLITAVQPVHFNPDATVEISPREPTGRLADLPERTGERLRGETPAATPAPGR